MKRAILITAFLASPSIISAQVLINEIAWMGVPVEGVDSGQEWRYEWIELFNSSTVQTIGLNGWVIELYGSGDETPEARIALGGTVPTNGFLVVGASEKIPEANLSYNNLGGKFANSGQKIVLRDAKGEIAEELDAREGWFAGENESKRTMERRFPENPPGDPENWGTSGESGGTPGVENSVFGKKTAPSLQGTSPGNEQASQLIDRRGSVPRVLAPPFPLAFLLAAVSSLLALAARRRILRA